MIRPANLAALLLCALFLLLGCVWIDRLGLQNDEVLFAAGVYPPFDRRDSVRIFKQEYPLMVMTYVGTLKAVLYRWFVFPIWPPSPATVRIPAVLAGAFSVWLFYRLLLRCLGARAALIGCALLATDSVYLLTIRWDWGPVAIQHLCLIGGMLALMRLHQERRWYWLALGFFVFGLGLWDKALFVWPLIGLAVATSLVFPSALRQYLKPRWIGLATLFFLLGALPLVIYNVRHKLSTFKGNAKWSTDELPQKVALVRGTLNGSALFGSIMREDWEEPLRKPEDAAGRFLLKLNDAIGAPRSNLLPYAFLACLLLAPLSWRSSLFCALFLVVTWLQMALTKGTGGGAHHTILLWPMPFFLMAAVLAELPLKASVPITMVLCGSSLAVTTTYLANTLQNGGTIAWSDALYNYTDSLRARGVKTVYVIDWGFYEPIRLLYRGKFPVMVAELPVDALHKRWAALQIPNPGHEYVTHFPDSEFFQGSSQQYLDYAEQLGYKKTDVRIFYDYNGRPVIQSFRLTPRQNLPSTIEQSQAAR